MNALAKHESVNLDELQRMARILSVSGYFDAKGSAEVQVAQICTKILAGRELGYGPFASVNGIHVIQGKPALGANLIAAKVKAHPRYDYRVRTMTDDVVSIEFLENGESLGVSTFTREDADKAKTQNMQKFPRNMLFARAISNGVRWFCPDVFEGSTVYTPDELGAQVDEDGAVTGYTVVESEPEQNTGPVLTTDIQREQNTGLGNGHHAEPEQPAQQRSAVITPKPAPAQQPANGVWSAMGDYTAARQWANDSGKFGHARHVDAAWSKLFSQHEAHKPENAAKFLAAWTEYVESHEPAKEKAATNGQPERIAA